MVILPLPFVSTKYTGYFWHLNEQRLYTLKGSGVLKPMKLQTPNRFNKFWRPTYVVSVNGIRRYMSEETLKRLQPENSIIPVFGG